MEPVYTAYNFMMTTNNHVTNTKSGKKGNIFRIKYHYYCIVGFMVLLLGPNIYFN